MKAVGMSDIGKCRKNNEDAYYISAGEDPAENLYLVADGMGGCNAGEIASSCAIEGFLEHFWKEMKHAENDDMLDLMTSAVAAANRTVYEKSNSDREFAEMGTTIVAAAVREEKLYVAYVGDSRAYLFRKKEMQPLTTDHSYVMELVKMGSITKEEAAMHPKRNVITRAIGIRDTVETDTVIHPVQKGDIVLLCTALCCLCGGQQSLPFSQKGDAAPHHRPFLCDGAGEDGEHYEGGSGNAPQKKRDHARHWDSGYRGDGYGDSSRAEGRHRLALYRWAFRYAEG